MDGTFLAPQNQYGDLTAERALTAEAPISGAPIPGSFTTQRPSSPGGAQAAPAPIEAQPYTNPPDGVSYYQNQAKMWGKLARLPNAGEITQAHAANARARHKAYMKGQI